MQNRSRSQKKQRHRHWQDSLRAMLDMGGDDHAGTSINVGSRLRELRNNQGLSIRSLAEISGLNFNTLSLIENEKTSPSVSTLQQLAQALQVPITAFFATPISPKVVNFQKSGHRPHTTFLHGLLEDLGAGITLGDGLPLLLTLEPSAESGPEAIVHTGQEFVYCLEGNLTYTLEGEEYTLSPGDSLIFQAHLPHHWGNRGNSNVRFLLILCPADENDHSTEQHFIVEQEEKNKPIEEV